MFTLQNSEPVKDAREVRCLRQLDGRRLPLDLDTQKILGLTEILYRVHFRKLFLDTQHHLHRFGQNQNVVDVDDEIHDHSVQNATEYAFGVDQRVVPCESKVLREWLILCTRRLPQPFNAYL
jgi:hypothetical protein